MANLNTVLKQAAEQSELGFVAVVDMELMSFEPQTVLAFVTLNETSEFDSTLEKTRTLVVKTSDGGHNWRVTLNTEQGSLVKDEIVILYDNENHRNIRHCWFITQWQIAATFPTLYWTQDFGETWQESDAIHIFLTTKGHATFNYAKGLRFLTANEGCVIATALSVTEEEPAFFLQTIDGGKTWQEIEHLPRWYFSLQENWRNFNDEHPWQVESSSSGVSVLKSLGTFHLLKP